MRRNRSGIVAVLATLAAALAMTTVVVAPAHATTPSAGSVPIDGPIVTLVTGDRVVLGDGPGAVVLPAPGREDVGYRQYLEHGDIYVVPNDAAPLLAAGRLDRRLFNVSQLIESGYHDAARKDVPLLVGYADGRSRSALPRVLTEGVADVLGTLSSINGAVLRTSKADTQRFWAGVREHVRPGAAIEHLWLDGPVRASTAESVPWIGAGRAWESGYTGDGVRVAVLDTGVDDHPDLRAAVAEAKDFTGADDPDDRHGHGTHVAGTITGDGTASDGAYRGVAPDAELVVGKVLGDNGSGLESWLLAGMEWAAQRAPVVNMSLGSALPDDGTGPMSQAVNRLTERTGALFVVASGNSGPGESTIGSPGSADAALTVGAVTKQDELAEFSSRGPRTGDHGLKPDITAPGQNIVAARAEGTQMGEPVGDAYTRASGTSMAAPHVAGAAAIVAQRHPGWRADELKAALMGSASAHDELTVYEQGAGRVDVARAVRQPVIASPASVHLGTVRWPHADDKLLRRTVTYTNTGSAPVTLDLAGELRGPGGHGGPGMLTVEPRELTVPAGGKADATIIVDTTTAGPDGLYGGTVTATAGDDIRVRTPVGVLREVESYDLDVTVLGRDGEPADGAMVHLVAHAEPDSYVPENEAGRFVARVPKGVYYLGATVDAPNGDGADLSVLIEPSFVVDADTSLVLDAREAKPLSLTVDKPDAEIGDALLSFLMETEIGRTGLLTGGRDLAGTYVRPSGTEHETFEFAVETWHARPDGAGGFAGSPYTYRVRESERRRIPSELTYRVHDDELARVRSTHADAFLDGEGDRGLVTQRLPFTLTEYFTPGVPWTSSLTVRDADDEPGGFVSRSLSAPRVFEEGETVTRRWNAAVFGPAFPYREGRSAVWAGRVDDTMRFDLPLHTGQSPGSAGWSAVNSGRTELYRGDKLIGGVDTAGNVEFSVPPEPGEYRLRVLADRGGLTPLSRRVEAVWTFRSAAQPERSPLPLLAVRFRPELDDHNGAVAGEPSRIPVSVRRNGSPEPPALRSLKIRVSFDGGQSWRPAPHRADHGQRVINVVAPPGAEDVSLKAVAVDHDGNRVEQTIIGAYLVS